MHEGHGNSPLYVVAKNHKEFEKWRKSWGLEPWEATFIDNPKKLLELEPSELSLVRFVDVSAEHVWYTKQHGDIAPKGKSSEDMES